MTRLTLAAALAGSLLSTAQAADLTIEHAFSRATIADRPGVGYVTIHGGDGADRLLSASSPRARRVELHSMTMKDNVMNMRQIDEIVVPANATVELAPGKSLHLMLIGLSTPLKQGERVPLTLHFEHAGDKTIEAVVGSPAQATMPPHDH